MTRFLAGLVLALSSTSVVAADLLPLKRGLYVPVTRACRGAPNSDIVNYWGDKSSIGASRSTCSIRKLTRKGNSFTLFDTCTDIQSGDVVEGGPTVLTIRNPTNFTMGGVAYRYCGESVQF